MLVGALGFLNLSRAWKLYEFLGGTGAQSENAGRLVGTKKRTELFTTFGRLKIMFSKFDNSFEL